MISGSWGYLKRREKKAESGLGSEMRNGIAGEQERKSGPPEDLVYVTGTGMRGAVENGRVYTPGTSLLIWKCSQTQMGCKKKMAEREVESFKTISKNTLDLTKD